MTNKLKTADDVKKAVSSISKENLEKLNSIFVKYKPTVYKITFDPRWAKRAKEFEKARNDPHFTTRDSDPYDIKDKKYRLLYHWGKAYNTAASSIDANEYFIFDLDDERSRTFWEDTNNDGKLEKVVIGKPFKSTPILIIDTFEKYLHAVSILNTGDANTPESKLIAINKG